MKPRTKEIIEIVGFISIVASLLFVGMQLVLDRRIAEGAQFHARTELFHDGLIAEIQNDSLALAWGSRWEDGRLPDYWTDELEEYRSEQGHDMANMWRVLGFSDLGWLRINNNYFQYQRGLISEATWDQQLATVRNRLNNPVHRLTAETRGNLEPGFKNIIQEMISAQ